jgi:hypothetical protein
MASCRAPAAPRKTGAAAFDHGGWMVNYWDDDMRAILGGWNQEAERPAAGPQDLRDLLGALAL